MVRPASEEQMRYFRAWISTVAAVVLLPACAFIDNEIQLEYQEIASAQQDQSKKGTIFLSLFNDDRSDKSKVGVIRNTYGMVTASVLTKDDPAIWVSNSLAGNLKKVGYKVETVEKEFTPTKDQFYMYGNIIKIFSNPNMGFFTITVNGDVQAFVKAKYNGRETQEMISGHSDTESLISTGGDLHKGVLNEALLDFTQKVMAWLERLRN